MTEQTPESSDSRPRPQYGEYATPEEQRARIQQPYASEALTAGQALDAPATAPPATAAPGAVATSSAPPRSAPWSATSATKPRPAPGPAQPLTGWRMVDRVVTFALLGYGLFSVVTTSAQFFQFEQYANTAFDLLGIDATFTNVADGRLWGAIAGATLLVGWILTAIPTIWQVRRGRVSFWIPIVGALVFGTIASVFVSIPLFGDPAFGELLNRFGA